MKITRVESFMVAPRWIFLKVHTDEGITGIGEAVGGGDPMTGGIRAAIEGLAKEVLIGQDPRRIEHHWQMMYRGSYWRGGPVLMGAISGIEIALWDILGKSVGLPIYQLLGGKTRDRIRLYTYVGGGPKVGKVRGNPRRKGSKPRKSADKPELEAVREGVRLRLSEGFRVMKLGAFNQLRVVDSYQKIDAALERVAVARQTAGPEVDLMLEFHGRVSPAMAILAEEVFRPFHPFWIEEPCLPENVDALAEVARHSRTPIATGERLFTRWGFREVLEKQAARIVQPDICACGGLFEARKIAAMAETYYAGIAPHCAYGPINLAVSLQLGACTPNLVIQEFQCLGEGYLKEPFRLDAEGYVKVPEGPGLGVELDEEAILAQPFTTWSEPKWLHPEDGSFADW
ncbi:MAG: galactonate dehydratase [Candidatus Latescibacteria bacterium]|nr:galactonate dehydratase [Candidatus Latescibacterota bacterium]